MHFIGALPHKEVPSDEKISANDIEPREVETPVPVPLSAKDSKPLKVSEMAKLLIKVNNNLVTTIYYSEKNSTGQQDWRDHDDATKENQQHNAVREVSKLK